MFSVIMSSSLSICAALANVGQEPTVYRDYFEMSVQYSNVALPESALTWSDLDRWEEILMMSAAQAEFMRLQYEQFVTQHNEVMEREIPLHLAQSAEAASIRSKQGAGSWDRVKALNSVHHSSTRVRAQLERVEHMFIESLAPILTDEQVRQLAILRREATRRQCRTFVNSVRWADIELRDIWSMVDREQVSPVELSTVQNLLAEYEISLTNLVCQQSEAFWTSRTQLAQVLTALHHEEIDPTEMMIRRDRILGRFAVASQRVVLLNERTLEAIALTVSRGVADEFVQLANEAAFPELYPDGAALHSIFLALSEDDSTTEDELKRLLALYEAYKTEYDQSCRSLEAFCTDWGKRLAAGQSGYQRQFLPDALHPQLQQRIELSRRYLETLQAHLGPEVLARHADAIPAPLRSILGDIEDEQVTEVDDLAP